jgi:hypothetical protein
LKEGGVKRSEGLYEGGMREVYIIRIMMVIARNSELKFQRFFEHHPF